MLSRRARPGYIFLVSVLAIGTIAVATGGSLLLLGWAAEQNGETVRESTQAFEYAQSCIERALRALKNDPYYAGNQTLSFDYGTCDIHHIDGYGHVGRVICATGRSGRSVRRVETSLRSLAPTVKIEFWREATDSSLCQ